MSIAIKNVVTDAAVDVATTSTLLLAANSRRKLATFVNASDTDVWIRFGSAAVVGRGIFLSAGGFSMEIGEGNLWVGDLFAIHAGAGTKKVSVMELD